MYPADLNLTTQVIGHGRFLFVSLSQGRADAALAAAIDGLGSLAAAVRSAVQAGDEMVVCLGAGDITSYANSLADDLKKA